MDPKLREALWQALLTADHAQRYWHEKACQYVSRDFYSKVFLAICTSSAVAGWSLWADVPLAWKTLSVAATLTSIVLPFVAISDKIVSMTDQHTKWLVVMNKYDRVWRDEQIVSDKEVRAELDAGKQIETDLSAKAIPLPGKDMTLSGKVYEAVMKDRA
jgi:hypothetical protein